MEAQDARPDQLLRTISTDGGIAVRVIVGTGLVGEALRRHRTSATASVALGRTLMGAVLLAASGKEGESVQLQFRGNGPLGQITSIADADGHVRGYVSHPEAEVDLDEGHVDVSAAVGRGVLAVVRQRADGSAPYNGIVPLSTGTIAQDIAHYMAESEQSQTAVALGVYLMPTGIAAAGGFFVHALPGARPEDIDQAEENVRGFPGPGELVREGLDADEIADRLLVGLGSRERHYRTPSFHCGCSAERVLRAVTTLGREELSRTQNDGESLEVHCRFCARTHVVSPEDLSKLLT
jgi:molecular chaperone Hsp33